MPDWIDLQRRLVPVEQSSGVDLADAIWFEPDERDGLTWEAVLSTPCTVLLGEAGSGKTTELRGQAERLRTAGRIAFFVPIEHLAKDGLATAVEGDPRLDAWRQGSEPGWFFLDSVDEAKLSGESLDRAIAKLKEALSGQLSRCRIVVSSRHSDWKANDEACLRRLLPSLAMPGQPMPYADQAMPKPYKRGSAAEEAPPTLRIVRLAQLNRNQIHLYSRRVAGVNNVDVFLEQIGSQNLWGFTRRPLDLQWITTYWRQRGKFGSLREMIEESIIENLTETKEPTIYPSTVSLSEAREGVENLALIMTMTGIYSVSLPSAQSNDLSNTLNVHKVFGDWNLRKISELLRRPIFDPATYGRVRLHHRDIREYLAASCLRRLRKRSLSAEELSRIVFDKIENRRFIRPRFEQVAAWLALDDPDIRSQTSEIAPEHLINFGDPSQLSPETRGQILRSYAAHFKGRKRTFQHFHWAGLQRFATDENASDIRELLSSSSQPVEFREALLVMIEQGKLQSLADAALVVAADEQCPPFLRPDAIRAVASAGTFEQKRELANAMIPRCAQERDTGRELLESLFPDVLANDDVAAIITSIKPRPDFIDGYGSTLEHVGTKCPSDRRLDLLEKLINIFEDLTKKANREDHPAKHLEWIPLAVVLLDNLLDDGPPASIVSSCLRLFEFASMGSGSRETIQLEMSLSGRYRIRRAAFWEAVQQTYAQSGHWPRESFNVKIHRLFHLTIDDAEWLERDAKEHPEIRSRVLAFNALAAEFRKSLAPNEYWYRIEQIAESRPELRTRVERLKRRLWSKSEIESQWGLEDRFHTRRRVEKERKILRDLQNRISSIRSGTDIEALDYLYQTGRTATDNWSGQAVANRYGEELAGAAKEGFRHLWVNESPPLRHEYEANVIDSLCTMGLLGLDLDVSDGLDVGSLNEQHLRKAITYAACKVNGFPAWLDICADRAPAILREVFSASLRMDYSGTDHQSSRLLWKLAGASKGIRAACAAILMDLLKMGDPPSDRVLTQVLQSLREIPSANTTFHSLCRSRCDSNYNNPLRLSLWWCLWFTLDMDEAIDFLTNEASGSGERNISEQCILACVAGAENISFDRVRDVRTLIRVSELVLRLVPPDSEVNEYTSPRAKARRFRDRLFHAIEETGAPEAIRWFDRLSATPWQDSLWNDYFKSRADQCAARSAMRGWSLEDALHLVNHGSLATMSKIPSQDRTAEALPTFPFPPPLVEAYINDNLAVLVGSGLSLASDVQGKFPKWNELSERLIQKIEHYGIWEPVQIKAKRDGLRASYVSLEDMLSEFDTLKTALNGFQKYQAALNHIFRPKTAAPGDVHRALVELNASVVLTTNYDELVEHSFVQGRRSVYTWREAEKVLSDIDEKRDVLFKVHGTAARAETVIMTQSEYNDASNHVPYKQTMTYLLQNKTFLMIGYGHNDPFDLDLIFKLNASAFGSAAKTHYALLKDPSPNDRNRLQREHNVRVVPYAEHSDLPGILRALRALKP